MMFVLADLNADAKEKLQEKIFIIDRIIIIND